MYGGVKPINSTSPGRPRRRPQAWIAFGEVVEPLAVWMPRSGGWDAPENFTGCGSAASARVQGCTLAEVFSKLKPPAPPVDEVRREFQPAEPGGFL